VYRLVSDAFAIHGTVPAAIRNSVFADLDDGAISFVRGVPDPSLPADRITPLYSLSASGTPAAPTGRLLVRFAQGDQANAHRAEVEGAGYRIVEILAYAPEAAWVESADGSIAHALARLGELESVAGVANVEPQMVSPPSYR